LIRHPILLIQIPKERIFMPIAFINIKKGRTLDQKRAMVTAVTKALCETMEVQPSSVRIIINEMADEHFAIGGTLVCDSASAKSAKS